MKAGKRRKENATKTDEKKKGGPKKRTEAPQGKITEGARENCTQPERAGKGDGEKKRKQGHHDDFSKQKTMGARGANCPLVACTPDKEGSRKRGRNEKKGARVAQMTV